VSLRDRCHGSACPQPRPEDALFREVNRNFSARTNRAGIERARLRDVRRRWIVGVATTAPATPMWTSREGWLAELHVWTGTAAGVGVLARLNVRPALLLRVAEVLAAHADHGTGRHCAVTNAAAARTARCSPRTVTTVRAVLREAGLAIEIRRGTGSAATPRYGRRASVWHLVSRRVPVDKARVCHLPPSRSDRRVTNVGKNSPSGRTRPPTKKSSTRTARRRCAPRPLAIQKLAAGVIAGSVGLGQVHPGHICDALMQSGLDVAAWTARQLLEALNADMRSTGWSWPDRVERPGGFLTSRLRRLPAMPPAPTTSPPAIDEPNEIEPVPPASAETRSAAMAYFQAHRGGHADVSVPITRLKPTNSKED
jgi:hypothetical protein